jgi:hypothetical protein
MKDWSTLSKALNQTMAAHAPGWTDRNDTDPGITILEVMAFLAENVLYRTAPVDGGESAASRIVQALDGYEEREPIVVRVNGERWERVGTIANAPPDAAVFTLDESTGVVTFGDGVHGRVPERGSTISVRIRVGVCEEGTTSIGVRAIG